MPFEGDEGHESGKSLRDRLEEALAAQKELSKQLHSYKVRDTLTEKGFSYVKPEELADVPADQVEAKAKALQEERVQLQQTLLKDALAKQGLQGDELDAMVTDLLSERQAASPEAEATARAQSVGRVEGALVPRQNPDQLHAYDAIEAAFAPKK